MNEQPPIVPEVPTLEYSNPRFERARKVAVGGLFLMGGFFALIGLAGTALMVVDFLHHPIRLRPFSLVELMFPLAFAMVGAADITCGVCIKKGWRTAVLWAFPLLGIKILAAVVLFIALTMEYDRYDQSVGVPLVLGVIVLSGLIGIGTELWRVWRGSKK